MAISESDFEKKTVETSYGNLSYYTKGEGKPLLYLHSADGFIRTPFLERLVKSRQIIAPVFPGFDETPYLTGVHSMETLAELCYAFLKGLGIEQVEVVGFSFGGWVAGWLVAFYPEVATHLIMNAPAGFRHERMPKVTREKWQELLVNYPEKASQEPKPYALKKKNQQAVHVYHGKDYLDKALLTRLKTVRTPTLLLFGEEDQVMPIESGKRVQEAVKHAELLCIEDAKHLLEIDQPEKMLQQVLRFLE